MKFSLFKYGTGVLYGYTTTLTGLDVDSGPSIGGNPFVLSGSGLDPRQWDDDFEGLALDILKWSDISVGGSLLTGALHLQLNTPAVAGSSAGIESLMAWGNTQGEARVVLPRLAVTPVGSISPIIFTLYVDALNFARFRVDLTNSTYTLYAEVYRGGAVVDTWQTAWSYGLSVLKILRWGDSVWFIANGAVVFRSYLFFSSAATFRIEATNEMLNFAVQDTIVEWFYFWPFVVFGDQPLHDTVLVSDFRLRGRVPPSVDAAAVLAAYKGLVDVSVVANGTVTATDAYEYYYVTGLTLVNSVQQSVKMQLINDPQIESPSGKKGLGDGY